MNDNIELDKFIHLRTLDENLYKYFLGYASLYLRTVLNETNISKVIGLLTTLLSSKDGSTAGSDPQSNSFETLESMLETANSLMNQVTFSSIRSPITCGVSDQLVTAPADFTVNSLRWTLVHSAVENLISYQRFLSQEFSSLCKLTTTDIQAMETFKCGLHELCLQLCQNNVSLLCHESLHHNVYLPPFFIPVLVDDDLVTVIGLIGLYKSFIKDPNLLGELWTIGLFQVTLSVHLSVQCKVRLKHSTKSLIEELRVVKTVHSKHPVGNRYDRLLLSFVYRYLVTRIKRTIFDDRQ